MRLSSLFQTTVIIALSISLAACSLTPDYDRPKIETPTSFEGAYHSLATAPISPQWWASFGDPQLSALMKEALANNLDIAAALARIDQAQGSLRAVNSSLLPQVSAGGNAGYVQSTNAIQDTGRSASGNISISYALDLWGQYRARGSAAQSTYRASQFDHEATALLVQSSVATTYFTILTYEDRISIAQDSLKAAKKTLSMVESAYKYGAISGLDLAQQRSSLASIEATIPTLENQLTASRNALAILLGHTPEGFVVPVSGTKGLTLPNITISQPSVLLERRPDIRRAEAQLIAANANIGVARAAFFPSIDLSAIMSVNWLSASGLSNGSTIAAALIAPIFSGGELEGNLEISKGKKAELVAIYKKTVLTSFGEVENALSMIKTSATRVKSLTVAANESKNAYQLAQEGYRVGESNFTSVLDAQRSWLASRDTLAQAHLDELTASANLFIALGGGWKNGDFE